MNKPLPFLYILRPELMTELQYHLRKLKMGTYMIQPIIAILISSLVAIRGFRRKSLDLSGAVVGFIVMTIHIAVGFR